MYCVCVCVSRCWSIDDWCGHGVKKKKRKKRKRTEKSKKKKLHTYNPYVNAFELRPICYPESHYLQLSRTAAAAAAAVTATPTWSLRVHLISGQTPNKDNPIWKTSTYPQPAPPPGHNETARPTPVLSAISLNVSRRAPPDPGAEFTLLSDYKYFTFTLKQRFVFERPCRRYVLYRSRHAYVRATKHILGISYTRVWENDGRSVAGWSARLGACA